LEKSYPQPDGSRIQVIAPTDLAVYPGKLETYSLCSPNRIPIFRCLC